MSADWTHYVTMATPFLMLLLAWWVKPILENVVNAALNAFAVKFEAMEAEAHNSIIRMIEKSQADFARHNSDPFAHPGLSAYEKLSEKMNVFGEDLAALREEVTAMRARVTRPSRKKK